MFWVIFAVWSILVVFLHYKNWEYYLGEGKPLRLGVSVFLVASLVFLGVLMVFYMRFWHNF